MDREPFSFWLGSVLGLLCLGGCQDLIGLKRPVSDDLFPYRDFFGAWFHGDVVWSC